VKCGKRTKQRIRNNNITMATGNVGAMLQPGQTQEVAQEMIRYRTGIRALQEVGGGSEGQEVGRTYTRIYGNIQWNTEEKRTAWNRVYGSKENKR
jgi:hypothetical protein